MAVSLSQEEMNELALIANSGQSGARVAYYTKLAEFGIEYGYLALGVVLEDQLSGRVANAYLMAVAEREGVTVQPSQWAAIGNDLMLRDLAARQANIGSDGLFADLSYEAVRDYHELAFSNLGGTVPDGEGVSINAWTAYAPVTVIGASAWNQMLTESAAGQMLGGLLTFDRMVSYSWISGDPLASEWSSIIGSIAFEATFASGSPAVFADAIGSSIIQIGTHSGDNISVDPALPSTAQVLVMGLGGDDVITTSGAADLFDSGSGDDLFIAASGGDTIHGGTGYDTVDYSGVSGGIIMTFTNGSVMGGASGSPDQLMDIEALIGTAGADAFAFVGTPAMSIIESIDAGQGVDTLMLDTSNEGLLIDLANGQVTGFTTGKSFAALNFENAYGGDGNDSIVGNDADNNLIGSGGDDTIEGKAGNDTLQGGAGDDHLFGDAGADLLFGGDGDDRLYGGAGDDVLWGDAGNDYLHGGAGRDTMYGGAGDDYFYCDLGENIITTGTGSDVISFKGTGTFVHVNDFDLATDLLLSAGTAISYEDTADGLRCTYDDGAIAFLAGLSVAETGWLL